MYDESFIHDMVKAFDQKVKKVTLGPVNGQEICPEKGGVGMYWQKSTQ